MENEKIRIGHGYDVHQLVDSIPLIICGITIDFSKGSLIFKENICMFP